jgi:hypothetical protein
MGLSFTIVSGPRQHSHSQVSVLWDSWPHFTVSVRDSPNLEDQVPILYPSGTGWPGYTPHMLGSLFVTFYDSQGYCGGYRLLHSNECSLNSAIMYLPCRNLTIVISCSPQGTIFWLCRGAVQ